MTRIMHTLIPARDGAALETRVRGQDDEAGA